MSKSSSAIGPLNESAVGIVYLRMIEPSHQGMAITFLPLRVFQLLYAISVASVRKKPEV